MLEKNVDFMCYLLPTLQLLHTGYIEVFMQGKCIIIHL